MKKSKQQTKDFKALRSLKYGTVNNNNKKQK